jgi:hypothetical protein
LQQAYDRTVTEITHESTILAENNRYHMQLMASKVIFGQITEMLRERKEHVMIEVKQYCKFDSECH